MADKIEWKFDMPDMAITDVNKFYNMNIQETRNFFESSTVKAQTEIKTEAPAGHTGSLKNSIDRNIRTLEASVFTNLNYAPVVEYGRRKAYAPYKALIPWIRRSTKGRAYFASIKSKYPKITVTGAAIALAKSMKIKAREGQKYFEAGVNNSWPYITDQYRYLLSRIAKKALR